MANGNPVDGPRTFEIGLVMAGSISAGAYMAGVMDFLIQALDQWEKDKDGGPRLPAPQRFAQGHGGGLGRGDHRGDRRRPARSSLLAVTGLPATGR